MLLLQSKQNNMSQQKALFLRAEGDCAILEIEAEKGKWVELIRERLDAPFSHIIEPSGIESAIEKSKVK